MCLTLALENGSSFQLCFPPTWSVGNHQLWWWWSGAINTAGTTKLTGQDCMCVGTAINPVSAGREGGNARLFPLMWGFHAWRFGLSLRKMGCNMLQMAIGGESGRAGVQSGNTRPPRQRIQNAHTQKPIIGQFPIFRRLSENSKDGQRSAKKLS